MEFWYSPHLQIKIQAVLPEISALIFSSQNNGVRKIHCTGIVIASKRVARKTMSSRLFHVFSRNSERLSCVRVIIGAKHTEYDVRQP